jgi:hypothetical protein
VFCAHLTAVLNAQAANSKINYVLSIFSGLEMKLAASKRKPIGRLLALSSSEPWDTVKAQILSTLDKALSPVNINIDDYEISYVIPRIVTQALPLESETDYGHMISKATKHDTDIKVTCIQKANKVCSIVYCYLILLSHKFSERYKQRE